MSRLFLFIFYAGKIASHFIVIERVHLINGNIPICRITVRSISIETLRNGVMLIALRFGVVQQHSRIRSAMRLNDIRRLISAIELRRGNGRRLTASGHLTPKVDVFRN